MQSRLRNATTGTHERPSNARRTSLLWGDARRPPTRLASDDPRRGLVGRVLDDRYEVTGVLGAGGMGVAYEARDRVLDRPVVVKVVAPSSTDPSAGARLMREAKLACRVVHPAIVAVHHLGMLETQEPYLVMERLVGQDLGTIVDGRGPLGIGEVAAVLDPIADALVALHDAGIVHRDVKPDNMLLLEGDLRRARTKLIDFGVAIVDADTAARMTQTGHLLGTAEYLAPECARGGLATPASDAYSFAVSAFELLAGQLPHEGSGIELLIAKTKQAPRRVADTRREAWVVDADQLLARGLSISPDARPSVLELAEGLRSIATRVATERLDPTVPGPIERTPTPNPAPAAPAPNARGITVVAWLSFFASLLALATAIVSLGR